MGCLLRGIKREQVQRGQVITIPNSIDSVKQFKASIYVRPPEFYPQSGRHTLTR